MLVFPYADLEFADDFTDIYPHLEDWNLLDQCEQERYLMEATLLIDSAYRYIGNKQPGNINEFPRTHQKEVPNDIKVACVLIACDSSKREKSAMVTTSVQRDGAVIEERIDDMVIKYASGGEVKTTTGLIPNSMADRLLKKYIKRVYR